MLTGDRVTLRAASRQDLPVLSAMYNDLELQSLLSDQRPVPEPLAQLEASFDSGHWQATDQRIPFVIDLDGACVGSAGLHTFDSFSQTCHLGIGIVRERWGQGLGQDAVRTLVAYAFDHVNIRKLYLEVLAHDERAVGAYRKAGFVEEGRFVEHTWHAGAYVDVLRMARMRPTR